MLAGILVAILVAGCGSSDDAQQGLVISEMNTGLGSVDVAGNEQALTYELFLINLSQERVHVVGIEPQPTTALNAMLLNETLWLPVDQELRSGASIRVAAELLLDTTGLTKAQIDERVSPPFSAVVITTEMILPLPNTPLP
jgi:hypothetical protein